MKKSIIMSAILCATLVSQAQWIRSNYQEAYRIWGMAVNDTNLYAAIWTRGIYRSNDDGQTWTMKSNGLTHTSVKCLESTNTHVYVAGWGVSRSGDYGENWADVNNGLLSLYTYSLAHTDDYIYVGSLGGYVYYSANNGDLWNAIPISNTDKGINKMVVLDTMLFAGTDGGGIFRTGNNGAHWEPVNNGLAGLTVYNLEMSGNKLYASTYWEGLYCSADHGETWVSIANNLPLAPDTYVLSIVIDGSTLFAGLSRQGVYVTQDQGITWYNISEGIGNQTINALEVSGNYLVAGTEATGIWYRPLADIYNYLEVQLKETDSGFSLGQNYPNPAKSLTTITFSVPYRTNVNMRLYDQSGALLATMADEYYSQGSHQAYFDAGKLPDGVYYYQLKAGPFISTRKLVLIK